jgi:hypothetical protein
VSEEQMVEYLRSRGRVEPPAELVASVMAAVDAAPHAPARFSAYLPAFVAVCAAAAVAVLALVLGPGRDVGPAPTPSAGPTATASEATVDELGAAVTAAVGVLRSQPGVEGVGTYGVRDELGSVSWFSWRPDGDQVVVNLSDIDVTESGWWLGPNDEPPARGVNIQTTIQVLTGSSYYSTRGEVGGDDAWITGLRSGSPDVLGVPFPAALDGGMDPWQGTFALTLEGEASVRPLDDGGEIWTLTRPIREGSLVQEFDIGPDGALRSMSHELVGVEPTLDERPITSALIQLTILDDPEPIPTPDVDSPPDPTAFGMPDLPLAPGPADADIDYRAYVEDALDVLEAYHWDSANIDWETARAAALEGLPAGPDAAQAHQRILTAIQTFDTFRTQLIRPQDIPRGGDWSGAGERPSGERIGDIGFINLPSAGSDGDLGALSGYLAAARTAMAASEGAGPACGWIVDLRDYAGGGWGPIVWASAGLLGEGRAITFSAEAAEWGLEIAADGTVMVSGSAGPPAVSSPYVDLSFGSAGDRFLREVVREEPAHRPAIADAPVAVLVGPATAAGGEQGTVAFLGRPDTQTSEARPLASRWSRRTFRWPMARSSASRSGYPLTETGRGTRRTSFPTRSWATLGHWDPTPFSTRPSSGSKASRAVPDGRSYLPDRYRYCSSARARSTRRGLDVDRGGRSHRGGRTEHRTRPPDCDTGDLPSAEVPTRRRLGLHVPRWGRRARCAREARRLVPRSRRGAASGA